MTHQATDSPPNKAGTAPVVQHQAGAMEIISAAMVAAVAVHLVVASAGGMFIFPWIAGMFAVEPKPKVVKKESVEVEMVEPVTAEPPPPDVQTSPPDQPPPPEAMPTPMEPQLLPPVLNVPAEVPERNPLPRPRIVSVNPINLNAIRTNASPYIPGGTGTGVASATAPAAPRYVQAKLYQRSDPVYPYEARKRRIQGTVMVEAIFAATGQLLSFEIVESSGHPILDKAAREHCVQNLSANPGQAERVRFPIEYRLVAP